MKTTYTATAGTGETYTRKSAVTQAARRALQLIDSGHPMEVTRQMMDRLSWDGLIDFGLSVDPVQGWYVTDKGREVAS